MKKINLFLVLLTFSLSLAIGQEPIAVIGQAHESKDPGLKFSRMLTVDESGIYILRQTGTDMTSKEYFVEKYDHSFNPVYSKSLHPNKGVMGDMIDIHSIITIKGKIFVFKEGFKKAITKGFMNAYSVSADGEVSELLKELDSFTAEKVSQTANYSISLSPDQSKIVLLAQYPSAKDVNERIRLKVFDTNFNELWTKEITYTHPSKGAYLNEVKVNNAGDVFILKKMVGEKYHFYYKLYVCGSNGSLWKEHTVNTSPNFVSEIFFKITPNGNALAAGLYGKEMKWQERQYGTFFFSVNGNGEITAEKTEAFPEELLKDISNRTFKTGSNETYTQGFKVKEILERTDGGLQMLTEFYSHTTESKAATTPGAFPITLNHETYGQILSYTFSPQGQRLSISKVGKDQFSKIDDGAFSSFIYVWTNDKLILLYNQVELLYWTDKFGAKHEYEQWTADTYYKSFLTVLQADGQASNPLPLVKTYEKVPFKMSLNPAMYYVNDKNELFFMIEMLHHKRFAFGKFKL